MPPKRFGILLSYTEKTSFGDEHPKAAMAEHTKTSHNMKPFSCMLLISIAQKGNHKKGERYVKGH